MTAWNAQEDAILREWYPKGGWKGVAVRLPSPRGRVSIVSRAQHIGVSGLYSVPVSIARRKASAKAAGRRKVSADPYDSYLYEETR